MARKLDISANTTENDLHELRNYGTLVFMNLPSISPQSGVFPFWCLSSFACEHVSCKFWDFLRFVGSLFTETLHKETLLHNPNKFGE